MFIIFINENVSKLNTIYLFPYFRGDIGNGAGGGGNLANMHIAPSLAGLVILYTESELLEKPVTVIFSFVNS